MARGTTPPGMGKIRSRVGKKQVVAFLSPEQAESARDKARAEGKTIQEILGEAINAVFAFHGKPSPIEAGHGRIVRRIKSAASIRTLETNPACRSGRISVGGWFKQNEVNALTVFAAELGASIQSFVQYGMHLVTDVEPGGEDWKVAAGQAPSPARDGMRLRGRPKTMGIERRSSAKHPDEPEEDAVQKAISAAKAKLAAAADMAA